MSASEALRSPVTTYTPLAWNNTCGYFTEVLVKGPAGVVKPAGAADGVDAAEGEGEGPDGAFVSAKEATEYVEQKQHVLGVTASTDLKADVGDVIRVKPVDLVRNKDGSIVWKDAEGIKFLPGEEPDAIEAIRKLAEKRKD